jgi:hypothetical protein
MTPKRRFAILTCMDARLSPAKYAGISESDAHVVRQAGGRASDDAICSLVIGTAYNNQNNNSNNLKTKKNVNNQIRRYCSKFQG